MRKRTYDIEKMAKLWREGLTADQFAERFGVSAHSIRSFIRNHRDKFPKRTKGGSNRYECE